MWRCWVLILCFLPVVFKTSAQDAVGKADPPYSLTLTSKLHSAGHSIYSGTYLNHDLNMEINLLYKYRQVGASLTKSLDVENIHSPLNFATVGIFKSFQMTESFKLTPYVGYFFRQSHSFMDDNSDLWTCLVARLNVTNWFTIENSALLANLVRHYSKASFANRMNAIILIGKFRLDAYAWYAHSFSSTRHFVSSSLAITSPDWVITPSISARIQVGMIQQITTARPEGARLRGGLISLIVPISLAMDGTKTTSKKI